MNAATPAETILPFVVSRDHAHEGRHLVFNQRGKQVLPELVQDESPTLDEVVDYLLEADPECAPISDQAREHGETEGDRLHVLQRYELLPDPEIGRAAMDRMWSEVKC